MALVGLWSAVVEMGMEGSGIGMGEGLERGVRWQGG